MQEKMPVSQMATVATRLVVVREGVWISVHNVAGSSVMSDFLHTLLCSCICQHQNVTHFGIYSINEVLQLKTMFDVFDSDNSKSISLDEFMNTSEWSDVFHMQVGRSSRSSSSCCLCTRAVSRIRASANPGKLVGGCAHCRSTPSPCFTRLTGIEMARSPSMSY